MSPGVPAIEVRNLNVRYGSHQALEDVSLRVEEGDYLAIMGPNGGGKSTLLKAILGLKETAAGEVSIFGGRVSRNRHLIGYVPQISLADRDFPITVEEAVLAGTLKPGFSLFHRYSRKDRETAREALEKVGLGGLGRRSISALSGGQYQKMLIARALAAKPRILLLDEPTSNVDLGSSQEIYELLGGLNRELTILLVTHNVLAISSHVRALACLNRSLVYHGDPTLTPEVVDALYGCPVELVAHGVPHRVLGSHEGGVEHA